MYYIPHFHVEYTVISGFFSQGCTLYWKSWLVIVLYANAKTGRLRDCLVKVRCLVTRTCELFLSWGKYTVSVCSGCLFSPLQVALEVPSGAH